MDIVTGAFSYTGKYIAGRLLGAGREVMTLTGHPDRPDPFGGKVAARPFRFDGPDALARDMKGAEVLYNTYWIRFEYGGMTFQRAVDNTRAILRAAREAGVRRVVHISITNASTDSPYPYFRGKGQAEEAVRNSGMSYAIVRPTVMFGHEGILINNIAWFLRRFPVFAVPGDGKYRLQPVHVEDTARLAVEQGGGADNVEMDAAGPDVLTFEDLVRTIRDEVGGKARIIHMGAGKTHAVTRMLGAMTYDVVLTRDEIDGLMQELLISRDKPTGRVRFGDWLLEHGRALGSEYISEVERHFK